MRTLFDDVPKFAGAAISIANFSKDFCYGRRDLICSNVLSTVVDILNLHLPSPVLAFYYLFLQMKPLHLRY